jgi:hypothetical protein
VKALTLWPEWIPAILHYGKRIENRPWRPREDLVGLALHSGMRVAGGGDAREAYAEVADLAGFVTGLPVTPSDIESKVTLGTIVAVMDVFFATNRPEILQRSQQRWFFGPWGWVLDNVRVLTEPVACRGHQGLWPVPPDVEAEVRRRLP